MMSTEPWTIRRLLTWTEGFLREKAIDSPRLDAQILLAHVLKCKRIDLYVRSDEEPSEPVRTAFKDLIRRRVEGCPVAYLVGQREFYLLTFEVNSAVLIPRPETELLVTEALRLLKGKEAPRVLDIGTGSGCIALAIARHHASARITATDISGEALAVARRNAESLRLSARVRFLQGDLFEPVGEDKFDLIASNPPYVSAEELPQLMKEVRDFEPRQALDGGPDGLAIYRRLIEAGPAHLNSGCYLLMEIGATQENPIRDLLVSSGSFDEVSTHRDGLKLPRVIAARKR
jgi:release factor glutamine methyltransferase